MSRNNEEFVPGRTGPVSDREAEYFLDTHPELVDGEVDGILGSGGVGDKREEKGGRLGKHYTPNEFAG